MAEQATDISATALLAKLEDEVAAKLQAIAGIRAALGLPGWSGAGRATPAAQGEPNRDRDIGNGGVIRPDQFFRKSIPNAIRDYLTIVRKPQSPKAITDGLREGGLLSNAKKFYSNITTAIGRLEAAGVLVNTPNGWGLAEWYPSRPKCLEPPKGAKKRGSRRKGASKAAKKEASKDVTIETADTPRKAPKGGYRAFVGTMRRQGKTMTEAAAAWRAQKASTQ